MTASVLASATLGIRKKIKQDQRQVRQYNKSIAERKNKKHASVKSIRYFVLHGKSDVTSLNKLLKNPSINQVIRLATRFREMINGNLKQYSLVDWIKEAMNCDSKAIRVFAKGIKADQQAVQNAMDIYLNNGVLEGTVNKIKAIKRQMFNRANYRLINQKLIAFKT